MDAFDDLMLGYVLKKLTDLFEEIVKISKDTTAGCPSDLIGIQQRKSTKRLPVWLGRLRGSTPFQVTHILIDQMHAAREQKRDLRFEAQSALLDALVEEGMAMHVASYSVVVLEKRLKCFLDR